MQRACYFYNGSIPDHSLPVLGSAHTSNESQVLPRSPYNGLRVGKSALKPLTQGLCEVARQGLFFPSSLMSEKLNIYWSY